MTDARHTLIDYDRIAGEYALHRKIHPEVLRELLAESGIQGGSSVLEVGCGTGNYIAAVQSAIGCSCWGTDPSSEMLAEASERPGSVTFQTGRAERLECSTGFFDLVFSVDVIHHLENITAYFREVRRVLKRAGGRVPSPTLNGSSGTARRSQRTSRRRSMSTLSGTRARTNCTGQCGQRVSRSWQSTRLSSPFN